MLIDTQEFLHLVDHDQEMVRSLFQVFQEEWPKYWKALEQAFQSQNSTELIKAAHKIKGTLLNFFAEEPAELARKIEEQSASASTHEIQSWLQALKPLLAQVEQELYQLAESKP